MAYKVSTCLYKITSSYINFNMRLLSKMLILLFVHIKNLRHQTTLIYRTIHCPLKSKINCFLFTIYSSKIYTSSVKIYFRRKTLKSSIIIDIIMINWYVIVIFFILCFNRQQCVYFLLRFIIIVRLIKSGRVAGN